jgi:hypothetical protein
MHYALALQFRAIAVSGFSRKPEMSSSPDLLFYYASNSLLYQCKTGCPSVRPCIVCVL